MNYKALTILLLSLLIITSVNAASNVTEDINTQTVTCTARLGDGYARGQSFQVYNSTHRYLVNMSIYIKAVTGSPGAVQVRVTPVSSNKTSWNNPFISYNISSPVVGAYNNYSFAQPYQDFNASTYYSIAMYDGAAAGTYYSLCYASGSYTKGESSYVTNADIATPTSWVNEGAGLDYTIKLTWSDTNGLPTASNTTYTFNAVDLYDNVAEDNVTFSTSVGSCTTSSGTCVLSFAASQGTVYWNASKSGFFNVTGTSEPNTTGIANITQGVYNLSLTEKITNQSLTNFTVSNGGKNYANGVNVYVTQGINNLSTIKTGYYTLASTLNVSSVPTTGTDTITGMYNATISVYIRTIANASITNSTNVTIRKTDGVGAGYQENLTVTSGVANFSLIRGEYNISVEPLGYEFKTYLINLSTNTTNYYSLHYTRNSISFNFTDEITRLLVNTTTISVELISDAFSNNYTTANGTLYVDLLTPESYSIRYRATGYTERFYSLTLEDNYHYFLTLKMLNSSIATNCSIKVHDNIGNAVESATVKLLKYDVATNSFILNQVVDTNFEGEAYASVVENTEYYKFIIEYDGSQVFSTSATYIFSCPLEFYINIAESGFTEHFTSTGLMGNITHDYSSHLSQFLWTDNNNVASSACVYVYKYPDMTLYNSTCGAGSSGVIYVGISNATADSYIEKGYVTTGGKSYLVSTNFVTYTITSPSGTLGVFMLIIVFLTVVFIGFWSLTVATLLGSIAPLLFTITGLWSVGFGATVPIFIVGLIIAYLLEGK